eukprot:CAMPEP_0184660588 /NCGR_PEP_ID=MMETSP0308-20130426/34387_1 /TAXON_ID=38269 /ORGANISM="Gloeochaete witrockiana, Strain SAG 46.84" /LENGTH=50 /DNA_ID=CAMNT_0027101271 /DNA_START=859 /DNA_END=1011 /DNA_ORIENTATION=-
MSNRLSSDLLLRVLPERDVIGIRKPSGTVSGISEFRLTLDGGNISANGMS